MDSFEESPNSSKLSGLKWNLQVESEDLLLSKASQ